MKKIHIPLLVFLFLAMVLSGQTMKEEGEKKVYAPFVSRIKAESKGAEILISWIDAKNLRQPIYHIYASEKPIEESNFDGTREIAQVNAGVESFLFKPHDSLSRYFLILAEEEGTLFDVFIPYRNISMEKVAAELIMVQEENAARISNLKVGIMGQQFLISADTSDPSRKHILFRSTIPLEKREDLSEASQVHVFVNEKIEFMDQLVPGIPFHYALVDKELYESGSNILLYEGSITREPVMIALDEWSPETAHSFKFVSTPVPLPMLDVNQDIEWGQKLNDLGIPKKDMPLSGETALALAQLDYGKAVYNPLWKRPELLGVDRSLQAPPETSWVVEMMKNRDWEGILKKCEKELRINFDSETRNRLLYYKGQACYFQGKLEYAFMDFLSSREGYYSESNNWLYNIYEQKLKISKREDLE